MKTFHLVKKVLHWVIEAEKPDDFGFVCTGNKKSAKKQAISFCYNYVTDNGKPCSLRIHKLNGQIQEERTYPRSADPKQSKG